MPEILTKKFNFLEAKVTKCEPTYTTETTILPPIKQVIFNYPATIILWADNTKTVVKRSEDDFYDEYTGFCIAVTKKMIGSNHQIKRLLDPEKSKIVRYEDGDILNDSLTTNLTENLRRLGAILSTSIGVNSHTEVNNEKN